MVKTPKEYSKTLSDAINKFSLSVEMNRSYSKEYYLILGVKSYVLADAKCLVAQGDASIDILVSGLFDVILHLESKNSGKLLGCSKKKFWDEKGHSRTQSCTQGGEYVELTPYEYLIQRILITAPDQYSEGQKLDACNLVLIRNLRAACVALKEFYPTIQEAEVGADEVSKFLKAMFHLQETNFFTEEYGVNWARSSIKLSARHIANNGSIAVNCGSVGNISDSSSKKEGDPNQQGSELSINSSPPNSPTPSSFSRHSSSGEDIELS